MLEILVKATKGKPHFFRHKLLKGGVFNFEKRRKFKKYD